MAIRVVLQSRLSSSRLPAKALLSLAGMPIVVLSARRASNTGLSAVVATSDTPDDDAIAAAVAAAGIDVVRGPLEDPLARFVLATKDAHPSDVVVRLTADNVLPDGELVEATASLITGDTAYVRVGGAIDLPIPYGVSVEAFTVAALREADRDATRAFDREHVTPWMRTAYGDRVVDPGQIAERWRGLRATIDTFDDFVRMSRALSRSHDAVRASWPELADQLLEVSPPPSSRPVAQNRLGQGPLVLGTVQLGLAYGASNHRGLPTEEDAREILTAASAAGVTHVDTARAYGQSEARIGSAMQRGLSEHVHVVTKIRPLDELPADAEPGWGAALVEASLSASLLALQSKSVAAVLTHRAQDWLRPGVRAALVDARDAGRTSLIGASLSSPEELLSIIEDPDLGYVQLPFNLLDSRWLAADVQEALSRRPDLIVTVRSVYLQGLLVGGLDARWPAWARKDAPPLVAAIDGLVADLGRRSRADLAVAYALGQPWVTSVVVGAESAEQIRDTASLTTRAALTPDECAVVERSLPAVPAPLIDPSRW